MNGHECKSLADLVEPKNKKLYDKLAKQFLVSKEAFYSLEKDEIKMKYSPFETRTPGLFKVEAEYEKIVYLSPKMYYGVGVYKRDKDGNIVYKKDNNGNVTNEPDRDDDHVTAKGLSQGGMNYDLLVYEKYENEL